MASTPIYSYSDVTPAIEALAARSLQNSCIDPDDYVRYDVKRGLRDLNGKGVVAGLTEVSEIVSNQVVGGKTVPCEGQLFYRGYSIEDLVRCSLQEKRFGFEEAAYLLMFGQLPTRRELDDFMDQLASYRTLPKNFVRDVILKAPSADMMNSLAKCVLSIASYDDKTDDISLPNVVRQCMQLIATFPLYSVYSYQAYNYKEGNSLYIHAPSPELSTAENILSLLRADSSYSFWEAHILDICLMLHAEHGGGNNSTFTTHVVTSSGTDTYSSIAAAIGSLKGPLHGGANAKVMQMFRDIREHVGEAPDDASLDAYLDRILDGEAGDRSGKIYGLGHAVYTMSDPRAVVIKKYAASLVGAKGRLHDLELMERVEARGIEKIMARKHQSIPMCANVDLYSGLIYSMLEIPEDLYTPLFATARIAGWCAHRLEELATGNRIMRPAYRAVTIHNHYVPMQEREAHMELPQ